MKQVLSGAIFLWNIVPILAQEIEKTDSLSLSWREKDCAEIFLIYEFTDYKVVAYLDETELSFNKQLNYIGFEESYVSQFAKGSTLGFNIYGLIGGAEVINHSKYSLRGFRSGLKYGYKFRIANRIVFEPNVKAQYANLRVKDKTTGSKLKNNTINLGLNFDLGVIPYLNISERMALVCTVTGGYLWKIPNNGWIASRGFNSQISAEPANWSGWYFGVKLGIIGID